MVKIKFLLILFLSVVSCHSIGQNSLTLLRGTSYNVAMINPIEILSIPIQFKDKTLNADDTYVQLAYLTLENNPDNIAISAFNTVDIHKDDKGNYNIVFQIKNSIGFAPGIYNITLQLKKKSSNEEIERFLIVITIKAAEISTISTINVIRIDPFPFMKYEKPNGAQLLVQEASRKANLQPLSIRLLRLTDSKGQPVSGSITFATPVNVQAAGEKNIQYSITGDFPLGKVTGNYQIVSPQLAAPVALNFEVTTKKGPWWLLLLIVGGLIFGYLLRTLFTIIINRSTARLKGLELLSLIARESAKRPDKKFQERISEIRGVLRAAIDRSKDTEITEAITKAEENLKAEIEKFNQRLSKAQIDLGILNNLIKTNWSLPGLFESIIASIRKVHMAAFEKIEARDVYAAEQMISNSNSEIGPVIRNSVEQLKSQLTIDLNEIESASFKIPGIKNLSDQIITTANQLSIAPDQLEWLTVFNAAHTINVKVYEFINAVGVGTDKIINNVLRILQESGKQFPDSKAVETLGNTWKSMLEKLKIPVNEASELLHNLPLEIRKLYSDLKDALLNQTNVTEQKDQVLNDLKNDLYTEAATKVVTFIDQNNNPPITNDIIANYLTAMPRFYENLAAPLLSFNTVTVISQEEASAHIQDLYDRTFRSLSHTRFWQTLLAGVAITFIGYVLFSENFIGTPGDMASVFFWGFTLDISVATVTAQATRVIKS